MSLTIKQDNFSKLLVFPLFQPFEFLPKIITVDIDARLGPVLFIPQKVFQIICPDIPKELFIVSNGRNRVNRAKPLGQMQV
jgi:hypothetical protein